MDFWSILFLVDLKFEWEKEFSGGIVVRTPRFHCGGLRFIPWLGN